MLQSLQQKQDTISEFNLWLNSNETIIVEFNS